MVIIRSVFIGTCLLALGNGLAAAQQVTGVPGAPEAVMPENAKLTPWPKELPQWDSLSWDEKKLFIKQADV